MRCRNDIKVRRRFHRLDYTASTNHEPHHSLAPSTDVTVELVQAAIESRWCETERRDRGVYIAFDMARHCEFVGGGVDKVCV